MRIKDIRQFRTAWKNEQNYNISGWDEHFVGSEKDSHSGFYKMINGIVNNIKADLTPKLQNAQDEQAIYEFLQNAADAEATHCAVIYDENYFLVLNNGKPFSELDLKAILNSFQGTKADKSKAENCGKIGRYGIGFKLAYRLLGKTDGAEELLNDYAGPLLFSWGSAQQFENLYTFDNTQELNPSHYAAPLSEAPWLLKIILTCFPTAPSEEVLDLERKKQTLFDAKELQNLSGFLTKHRELLSGLNLKQGSLFFIKFGQRKHEKLKESLLNLKSGIAYALNTLKTLKTVVLQDQKIEREEVILEKFSIEPQSDAFKRIEPEFPNCPIDIWLGLPPSTEAALALKTAPSIYQFFPMRNERHNLAFFVHGTSFMKITDRTRLDDQGDANTQTFSYLSEALKSNLNTYKRKDFKRFTAIYKAILLSDAPDKHSHQLVGSLLYKPLLEFAKSGIPTNKGNILNKDLVIIKKTKLAIEPMQVGIGKEWFFWDDALTHKSEQREASQDNKLALKKWGLKELIINAQSELINEWVSTLDAEEYQLFLEELKAVSVDAAFMHKLVEIKCFQTVDSQGNTEFLNLAALLNAPNVFLLSDSTKELKVALQELDFKVLEFKLDSLKDFAALKQEQLAYLEKPAALFKKIAQQLDATATARPERIIAMLKPVKMHIVKHLSDLKGITTTQIRELRLFRNKVGLLQPLNSLISPKSTLLNELFEPYHIHPSDYEEALDVHLIQSDPSEIYTQIVLNQFDTLAQSALGKESESTKSTKEQAADFLVELKALHKLKKGLPGLQNKNFVYINETVGFVSAQQIFWHQKLAEVTRYDLLEEGIYALTGLHVPAFSMLPLLNEEPFKIQAIQSSASFNKLYQDILQNAAQNTLQPAIKMAVFEALKPILDTSRLERIPLFSDQQNENKPLKSLCYFESPDDLLSTMCIKSEEFDAKLLPYFSKNEELLENIILPNIDKITSIILNEKNNLNHLMLDEKFKETFQEIEKPIKTTISKVNYFYFLLKEFYKVSVKKSNFSDKKVFFISNKVGFVSAKELFFNQKLLNFEAYSSLKKAFDDSLNTYLPDESVLSLIKENFFKIPDAQYQSLFKSEVIVSEQSLIAIFDFLVFLNAEPFMILTVEAAERPKTYLISPRKDRIPAYVGKAKSRLHELVQEKAANKFALMPEVLQKHLISKKGSLQEKEVFEYLMKFLSSDEAAEAALQSSDKNVQQHFYEKMGEIVVRADETYHADSFVVQALQAFRSKEANLMLLKEKFVLQDENGELYRLSDYAYADELVLYSEVYGKIQLFLSQIWQPYAKFKQLAERIVGQFPEAEQSLLRKKVLHHPEPITPKGLWQKLKDAQDYLHSASALAFVLCYAQDQQIPDKEWINWQIKTLDGSLQCLSKQAIWLLYENSVTESEATLAPEYGELERILKFQSQKPLLQLNSLQITDNLSVSRGYLRGLEAVVAGAWDSEAERLKVLDALLKTHEEPFLPLQISESNAALLERLLECSLSDCLYPPSYGLESEQLSPFVVKWLSGSNSDKKLAFLGALGLHTKQSDLWHLRHYLQNGGEPIRLKQINDLSAGHQAFILRTLSWCMQNKIVFSSLDERLSWLKRLYTALAGLPPHTPVPVITEIEDAEFFYSLADISVDKLFYFNEIRQNQLLERFGVTMEEVLAVTAKVEQYMSNLDLRHVQPRASKTEEIADLAYLAANSIEWNTDFYLAWKDQFGFEIRLLDGEMPYLLQFMDVHIKRFKKGNSFIDNKTIYLNAKSPNLEEELFALSSSQHLTQQHLLALLRLKNSRVKQSRDGHKDVVDGSFSAAFDQMKRAKDMLKVFLKEKDYAFSEQLLDSQGSFIQGLKKSNQETALVFKTSTEAYLEFTEQELALLQKGEADFVVFNGKNIAQVDFGQFLKERPKLHLELDMNQLDTEEKERLLELLQSFQTAKIRV
ncbi:MAG: hypothetical protein EAZ57_09845 [Cytophagales bacterium]|nr:MAG: hypothetical protein EAZ67_10355 [Cytophagales bacterium]TAF59838.1 MAG: hypothetical protein EAZ57_09845 [Cytophagales bacterium]